MARRRSHRRMHGLGSNKLARAAKACKGRPGSAFRSCVKSHMAGLGARRRRR